MKVVVLFDGISALGKSPDLAILDVKMPRLDGIDAARKIMTDRPIPIVILTAYGQDELVSRAVEAGVFGYLVKPIRETDLLPAIQAARARHAVPVIGFGPLATSAAADLHAHGAVDHTIDLRPAPAMPSQPAVAAVATDAVAAKKSGTSISSISYQPML